MLKVAILVILLSYAAGQWPWGNYDTNYDNGIYYDDPSNGNNGNNGRTRRPRRTTTTDWFNGNGNNIQGFPCPPHEVRQFCASYCQPTCMNPIPPNCPYACSPFGECVCQPGYLRDVYNCVRPEECSNLRCGNTFCKNGTHCDKNVSGYPRCLPNDHTCPINEEFTRCGSDCEPACNNPKNMTCTNRCVRNTCQCIDGYARLHGVCIPQQFCRNATTIHFNRCTNGQCPRGYRCDMSNPSMPVCVPNNSTANHTCQKNERFMSCGSLCEPTCDRPMNITMCPKICLPNICQCSPGYVRNGCNCTLVSECPGCSGGINQNNCNPRCVNGTICQLQANGRYQCVVDPSYNPCRNYNCPRGMHCVPKNVTCVRAPCPPVASCIR